MDGLTIILPLPAKELSPNSRGHWGPKAKRVKAYRLEARYRSSLAMGGKLLAWPSAQVVMRFYFRDSRRRDRDNLLASMKSAIDGIADAAVVINDSGLTFLPVEIAVDRKNPRVEVSVYRDESKV